MFYVTRLHAISNGKIIASYTGYFSSKIKSLLHVLPEELKQEALAFGKDKFDQSEILDTYDSIIIERIDHYYLHCSSIYNNFETKKDIEEISKKEYEEYSESKEGKIELLKTFYMSVVINDLKRIRKQAEELKLLDDQDYLNFLDSINELSIDQDRQ